MHSLRCPWEDPAVISRTADCRHRFQQGSRAVQDVVVFPSFDSSTTAAAAVRVHPCGVIAKHRLASAVLKLERSAKLIVTPRGLSLRCCCCIWHTFSPVPSELCGRVCTTSCTPQLCSSRCSSGICRLVFRNRRSRGGEVHSLALILSDRTSNQLFHHGLALLDDVKCIAIQVVF